MQARKREVEEHTAQISRVLAKVCELTPTRPLVRLLSGQGGLHTGQVVLSVGGAIPVHSARTVTSDLGITEEVVALPVPSADSPRYWLGLHEEWAPSGRNKLDFVQCGLRLYVADLGANAAQMLRLEWVAPEKIGGTEVFHGNRAAHPHWHIDRAALIGPFEFERSLEMITAPTCVPELESFDESAINVNMPVDLSYDCSWLPKFHLPAQSGWMTALWDGQLVPGPHQNAPLTLEYLSRWWTGSLYYVAAEIAAHG